MDERPAFKDVSNTQCLIRGLVSTAPAAGHPFYEVVIKPEIPVRDRLRFEADAVVDGLQLGCRVKVGDARLNVHAGDVLLQVDSIDVSRCTHNAIMTAIMARQRQQMRLRLRRGDPGLKQQPFVHEGAGTSSESGTATEQELYGQQEQRPPPLALNRHNRSMKGTHCVDSSRTSSSDISPSQHELNSMAEHTQVMQKTVALLQVEAQILRQENTSLRSALETARESLAARQQDSARHRQETAAATVAAQDNAREVLALRDEMQQLQLKLSELQSLSASEQHHSAQAHAALGTARTRCQALEDAMALMRQRIAELEPRAQAAETMAALLQLKKQATVRLLVEVRLKYLGLELMPMFDVVTSAHDCQPVLDG
ncbi:hypothetical protein JKP88DRAFT_245389 [Tribonema minus]|uniref:PDZ domain-containing protein n=1 Tax=Tribonema minus TaxID=303371 RepID=A0A835YWN0_9STRA|nr:hypothetical protein JKP88DRAFT_245389 [Tribonema minus]